VVPFENDLKAGVRNKVSNNFKLSNREQEKELSAPSSAFLVPWITNARRTRNKFPKKPAKTGSND
jgi:hypothetical protein